METVFLGRTYPVKFWSGEKLGTDICIDTETTIAPFTETPECVTVQMFDGSTVYYLTKKDFVDNFMGSDAHNFIMHNCVFDMDVLDQNPKAWNSKLEKERVWDTMLLYRLWHLATVGFVPFKASLDFLAMEILGVELPKVDEIRMGFGQFLNRPLSDIPERFITYGANDVIATFLIYLDLKGKISQLNSTSNLTHSIQLKGAYALNKIYKNGIEFDIEGAKVKYNEFIKDMEQEQDILACYGWVRGQKGCNEKYEDIVKNHFGLNLPLTDKGSISSSSEDLQPFSDNPFIASYIRFTSIEKAASFLKEIVRVHG